MAITEVNRFAHPRMSIRWRERLRRWLRHPRAALGLALMAMTITLPTLWAGMLGDDFLFVDVFNGVRQMAHPGSSFGLFTFSDGDHANNLALRMAGQVPWWVNHDARMMFWRPLSEWSHWLDHALWPRSPEMAHLHTVALFGALVYLLAKLYRSLDANTERAHFSALVFAVAPTHLLVITWLAARNQIIAGIFIVLTLLAHHRWRQGAGRGWQAGALLGFVAALASAEAGVAAAAYLVSYALFMEGRRSWVDRIASVLPYLLIVVLWRHQYNQLGYGTQGLAGYIDPGRDPLRFLDVLCYRMPSLLLASLFGVTSSALHNVPLAWRPAYGVGLWVVIGAMAWLLACAGLWRDRALRFWAVGMLLALVPVCAAAPNDRLLLNGEFGLAAILGTLVSRWAMMGRKQWVAAGQGAAHRLAQAMAGIHLVIFPVLTLAGCLFVGKLSAVMCHDEPMSIPDVPVASGQHVVLVNPPSALFVGYFPSIRRYFGRESGVSMHGLISGDQNVTLRVLDPYTLVMTGVRGFGDDVSRDVHSYPFRVGEAIDAGPFVGRVERVAANGYADVVRFRFKERVDSGKQVFFKWTDQGYVAFSLPAVGSEVSLPAGSLKAMLRHRLTGHW